MYGTVLMSAIQFNGIFAMRKIECHVFLLPTILNDALREARCDSRADTTFCRRNDTNLIEDCVEISHESDGQRKRFVDVIK
jgi:hypothetical protein